MVPSPLPAPHRGSSRDLLLLTSSVIFQIITKVIKNIFTPSFPLSLPASLDNAVCNQVCSSLGAAFVYCLSVAGADFLGFFSREDKI